MIRFTGILTPTPRGGGGTLIPVPKDVAALLGPMKGMPKVKAVIAGIPYRGSLMPMGDVFWNGNERAAATARRGRERARESNHAGSVEPFGKGRG